MRAEKRLLSGAAICGIYIVSSRDREQPNIVGKPNGGKSTKLRLAAHKETTVCAVFWLQRPIIFFPVLGPRQRTRPLESRWLGLTKYTMPCLFFTYFAPWDFGACEITLHGIFRKVKVQNDNIGLCIVQCA